MRILVVEDNRDHQFIIRKKLQEYRDGIIVDTSESVDEAERLIHTNDYESVILDYRLHGSSGIELVKWIQDREIGVPIIMITNMEDVSIAVKALKLGVYDYLCKNRESFDRLPLLIEKATEEYRLKKKLKETEFRYSTLVEGINEAVFLMNSAHEIVYISSSVERLFGCTEEECKKNFRGLFSDHGWQIFRRRCREVLQGGGVEPFVLMMKRKNGHTLMAEINALIFREHETTAGIIGTIQDVTKRVLLERELNAEREETRKANRKLRKAIEDLQRAQAQLVQSEKLAAVGQLVSGVAHELNNPLFSAMGNIELLIMDSECEGDEREKLEKVLDSINRARLIVRELVQFSQGESVDKQMLLAADLIQSIIGRVEHELKLLQVDIESDVQDGMPALYGNPIGLQRALINILINARKAFEEQGYGGLIRVRSFYDAKKGDIVIEIANNGPEIPSTIISNIFDPFFTTREVGEGTGLGLSTAYGIVKEHDGELAVESNQDWTVFTLRLPAKEAPVVNLKPIEKESDEGESPVSGKSVLIVESEPIICKLLSDFFIKKGCSVETASTGTEALEILEKCSVDNLVIDDRVADIRGSALIELIRKRKLKMTGRTLLIVENGVWDRTGAALQDASIEILKKPFSFDELLQALGGTK